jgi:MFS family permease
VVETEATRSGLGGKARPGLLIAGLSMVVLTVAVLQTAVVPVLGIIAHQLDTSAVAASWAVTANLLAAAAATPLIGRLADLHSKKHVLLTVLVVVLVGSLLAATTSSLALLIIARMLQAASYGLYPIGIAILREELPEDRMGSAMSVLSGMLGFGGGTGLVVVGLLMSGNAGYHRVFWLTTGFTVVVIAIAVLIVPARPRSSTGTIDWLGAAGLAAGLSAVLLAITQGHSWGWTSPRALLCAACGLVVLAAWWLWERRANQPLVSTEMMTRRPIMLTNLATVFVGMGLYFAFLGLTQFVQIPHAPRDTASGRRCWKPASCTCCRARSPASSSRWSAAASSTDSVPGRCWLSRRSLASWASCSSRSSIQRHGRSSRPASWPTPTSVWVTARCPHSSSQRSTPARPASPRA